MTAGSDFDLIVLGLGPGGEDVAEAMASAGWSVLGVDERLVGGECPYFGCIPSKMVLRGADLLGEARRVPGMAGDASVTPDFSQVAKRISAEATTGWDDESAVVRLEGTGAAFLRSAGRLAGRDGDGMLLVEAAGNTYRSRKVVLATGTSPGLPPIDGLADLHADNHGLGDAEGAVWTNRDALRATAAPASLVVMGGGAIGCELSQGFARFGTRVTLVEGADRILSVEEPEASQVVADVFAREGMDVRAGVKITGVVAGGEGVEVTLDDGTTVTAEKLLVAAGRKANLATLGLETVGLDPSVHLLDIDEHMRVLHDGDVVDGVYGIGDIAGPGPFTHVAVWQSRVLTAHLLGQDEPYGGYHALAWATFTDPEVGHVGMTEQQARDDGLSVRIGVAQIASNTRGWIHGPGNDGFVKVIEDADRGVLVGATVVGPYGGELIGMLTVAVQAEVPVRTLLSMHYVFPTLHRAVLEALRALQ